MAKRSPEDGEEEVAMTSENHKNGSYEEANDEEEEGEVDDVHHHQRSKKDKKKKKRKKVRIMTASGQTDADRRVLRRRQRELHTDISFDAPASSASAASSAGGNNNDNDSSDDDEDEEMEEDSNNNNKNNKNKKKSSSGLHSWREKNNELWNDVRFTREAVLDSENMDLISSKAAREVEKIIQVRLVLLIVLGVSIYFWW